MSALHPARAAATCAKRGYHRSFVPPTKKLSRVGMLVRCNEPLGIHESFEKIQKIFARAGVGKNE